ncbi:MAG: SMC-Scp complex subunit ScpB [Gammaproteobacteria bacterium]|nr:SMC-Scp complex subunit ScpB [Gammaproteobacteria bacterium]MDE2346043.1 SMC-Scp complex subunit ScpB [Gammaproteobacteria bacterium]
MTLKAPMLKNVIEAALLAAGRPLSIDELMALFGDDERPDRAQLRKILDKLQSEYDERGITLKEVASGFRIQLKPELANWIGRLWVEKPARYSRAMLETLSLIAYRQPITRGEIEAVRGVSVSPHIIRTLMERGWIRMVGHRDVPGHPELFGTTKEFLDYFSLKSLDDLPALAAIKDIDSLNVELDFDGTGQLLPDMDSPGGAQAVADSGSPADTEDGMLEAQDS